MNDWYKPNNGLKKYNSDDKNVARARLIGIILLSISIIAAAVVPAFSDSTSTNNIESSSSTVQEDKLPDDYHDFFSNYYTSTDYEKAEVDIEKYDETCSFRVQLVKSQGTDLSLQDLYNKCQNQIVSISCSTDGETDDIWGSGVVMSEDGLILTNTHVIDGCKRVTVVLSTGEEHEALLVGADTVSDLSVLKIETDEPLNAAEFADIDELKVGDDVAAIGSPLGSTFINTLTNGIVSGIERDIPHNGHSMTLIQTNTALNEGNSGGALFNMKGQVIGITNMKMNSIGVSIEGIGFAIPSTTVKTITDSLLDNGYVQRTTIGVVVGSIPQNVSEAYNLPNGLYVTEVNEDSGAFDAGIKVGDVITKVNDTEVKTTSEVNAIKDNLTVGDVIKMTVFREGKYIDFDVVLK